MKLQLTKDDLTLKTFDVSDADTLFNMVDENRSHLDYWFLWVEKTTKVEDSARYISEENKKLDKGKGVYLGIWHKKVLSGCINLDNIDEENKNATLGYWLSKDSVGKNIMYKSCQILIDHTFNTLKLHRLDINHIEKNIRSKNLIERLGFKSEGVRRESGLLHGEYVSHVQYGLLKKEWKYSLI